MNFRILTKRAICSPVFDLNQCILHETNENILLVYINFFVYWSENLRLEESSIYAQTQNHMFLEFPVPILWSFFKNDDVVIYNFSRFNLT